MKLFDRSTGDADSTPKRCKPQTNGKSLKKPTAYDRYLEKHATYNAWSIIKSIENQGWFIFKKNRQSEMHHLTKKM